MIGEQRVTAGTAVRENTGSLSSDASTDAGFLSRKRGVAFRKACNLESFYFPEFALRCLGISAPRKKKILI